MKKIILKLLVFYKKYISRGNNCRFVPSCSEYTYEAVKKYGVFKGLFLGSRRILKCNRFSKGGVDLVK
jgi:putative membrane protein insertion efficiency factor